MLGPVGHVGALFAYAFTRRRHQRDDAAAQAELAWRGEGLPPGLELEWLGAAGFRLTYEGQHLLVDPYLTRLPLGDLLRRRVVPAAPAALAHVPDPIGIIVGHTHFDHALDVPALAIRAGCKVYGSASLARLMELHGRRDLAVEVTPHAPIAIGPFTVRFVPSKHSKLAAGLWTPYDGEITCEHTDELTPQAYRCGAIWGIELEVGGARLYHTGSCDLDEDAEIPRGVDVFLCGIAGRRFTKKYVERILRRVEPRLVVPCHHDDFFRPLAQPMGFSLNVDLAGFTDEVRAVSADFPVRTIGLGGSVAGAPRV
ncbi:MAG TPA: MBL fold metallo-hydrolase [Kofleriaceae bacterium]|nr:MBL fold metallo-hydrolase [Kofleriaceae bacterium]